MIRIYRTEKAGNNNTLLCRTDMSFINVPGMTSGPIKRQTWDRIKSSRFGVIQSWVLIPAPLHVAV